MPNSIEKLQPKILVVGDLMIDKYLWGECNRVSPEAPVQIINVKKETKVLGGAGNVANNLVSLGSSVEVLSVIGGCEISNELRELFNEINLSTDYLIEQKDRVTSKKTRIISAQQQVIRYDIESDEVINKESEKKLIEFFKSIVNKFELVILSDYGKGVLTNSVVQEIIRIANSIGIKVIVDPKGSDYSKYSSAYLLTPNKKEASEATGINISDENSLKSALTHLKESCKLNTSLITLSEDGIAIFDDQFRSHPTVAKEVFDVTGAGDTVIAALGYALATKQDIDSAVVLANLAAGVVVGKIGSATASFEEIISYESMLHHSSSEENIIPLKMFIKILNDLRKSKNKIVFTNGCFDILHVGHVKYLEKAKKLGDILIVGINSDSSVSRLKGEMRPINSLEDRSHIIASLKSVDYVIPFEEDTPIELIKAIVPDILAKGSDYKNKNVVGEEIAKELVLIDFVEGRSTSNTILKIQADDRNN